jgi:hypothetical protein
MGGFDLLRLTGVVYLATQEDILGQWIEFWSFHYAV